MDSLSDTFINAFSKVRKPDARFIEMSEELERFEEGLTGVERLVGRGKNRVDGESIANAHMHIAGAHAFQISRRTIKIWRLRIRP